MKDTILGVDLGWVSQLESIGYRWVDDDGRQVDPIGAAKDLGANTVRLRVFVNPPEYGFWVKPSREVRGHEMKGGLVMLGFCDKDGVVGMARRVKESGMRLMIDFHYSDHFADPMFQDIPDAWTDLDVEEMTKKVAAHTKEVLTALKDAGVIPEYVQVGNEINTGILLPAGSRQEHPAELVRFLNAGYDAVKEVCPQTCVVTHVGMGHIWELVQAFFDVFFQYEGKTDMIGLSYYPAWFREKHDSETFLNMLNRVWGAYQKPIVLSEIGGRDDEEEETYRLLSDTLALVDRSDDKALKGMIYWEPETNKEVMPDKYPLGAARLAGKKTLQYTKALAAYGDYVETWNGCQGGCAVTGLEKTLPSDPQLHSHVSIQKTDARCS